MIRRFWHLFLGYIVVTIKGRRTERFLNRMAEAGISVWEVERLSTGMLVARMEAAAFKRARALCRRQGWQISIVDRFGFPFMLTRLWRRKGLFLGGMAALGCLYIASGYIWFVDVEGTDDRLASEVIAVAEKAGLKRNVRAQSFDPKTVQLEILLNIEDLSWATVHIRGTRAVIEVAERTTLDANLSRPGDMIAGRDGIIERIAVSQGYPIVREGDTVRRGDIIISGFIPPEDPRHRQMLTEGKSPYVRADGVVAARVWYEGKSRVRLVAQRSQGTGKRAWNLRLAIGDHTLSLGKGATAFGQFEAEPILDWEFSIFSWRGRITHTRYKETVVHSLPISEEEARKHAAEIAMADLQAQLPEGVDVADGPFIEIEIVDGEAGPVVEASARAEIVEGIASYRLYP